MIKHFFSQRSVQVGATILLSALVFYIAFRSFSWTEFLAAISRFDRRWLLPSISLALIGYGVRALRWQVILQPIQPVPLPFLFQATVYWAILSIWSCLSTSGNWCAPIWSSGSTQ